MGFNNGYESGYSDCETDNRKKWEEAAVAKYIAENPSSGGGDLSILRIKVGADDIVPGGDDGPATVPVDLSRLQVGQVAIIEDDPASEAHDGIVVLTLPTEVTSKKVHTWYQASGASDLPYSSVVEGKFLCGNTTVGGSSYPRLGIWVAREATDKVYIVQAGFSTL